MAIEKKLSGGREAMVELRLSGPMPANELLGLMEAKCGCRASDAKYRARKTFDILLERGAFVVRDGMACPEYAGDYSAVMDVLSKGKATMDDISDATGLGFGDVSAILHDLNHSGVAVRLPKSKGKLRWALLSSVPEDYIGATTSAEMYEKRILELCSSEAKTSEEIAIGIGEPLSVTRGYLRCLSSKCLIGWTAPSPGSPKLWFATKESKQDAYRLISDIREEDCKGRPYPKLSDAPSIKGRNPDYIDRDSMKTVILSHLDGRAMTEGDLMAEIGRTRSINSIVLEMWKNGLVDRTYADGTWKWKAAPEGI